jgi:uncharacterized protein YcaQ
MSNWAPRGPVEILDSLEAEASALQTVQDGSGQALGQDPIDYAVARLTVEGAFDLDRRGGGADQRVYDLAARVLKRYADECNLSVEELQKRYLEERDKNAASSSQYD